MGSSCWTESTPVWANPGGRNKPSISHLCGHSWSFPSLGLSENLGNPKSWVTSFSKSTWLILGYPFWPTHFDRSICFFGSSWPSSWPQPPDSWPQHPLRAEEKWTEHEFSGRITLQLRQQAGCPLPVPGRCPLSSLFGIRIHTWQLLFKGCWNHQSDDVMKTICHCASKWCRALYSWLRDGKRS